MTFNPTKTVRFRSNFGSNNISYLRRLERNPLAKYAEESKLIVSGAGSYLYFVILLFICLFKHVRSPCSLQCTTTTIIKMKYMRIMLSKDRISSRRFVLLLLLLISFQNPLKIWKISNNFVRNLKMWEFHDKTGFSAVKILFFFNISIQIEEPK